MLIIAAAIKLTSKGPDYFQTKPVYGMDGKKIKIYKFSLNDPPKTMATTSNKPPKVMSVLRP